MAGALPLAEPVRSHGRDRNRWVRDSRMLSRDDEMQYVEISMLRMFVRSISFVAILAGTAAAAGDPLPTETGRPEAQRVESTKVVKKKTSKKTKKKAARKAKKKAKKAKRAAGRTTP